MPKQGRRRRRATRSPAAGSTAAARGADRARPPPTTRSRLCPRWPGGGRWRGRHRAPSRGSRSAPGSRRTSRRDRVDEAGSRAEVLVERRPRHARACRDLLDGGLVERLAEEVAHGGHDALAAARRGAALARANAVAGRPPPPSTPGGRGARRAVSRRGLRPGPLQPPGRARRRRAGRPRRCRRDRRGLPGCRRRPLHARLPAAVPAGRVDGLAGRPRPAGARGLGPGCPQRRALRPGRARPRT